MNVLARDWQLARARALELLSKEKPFDESEHPRDSHGKFTFSGGGDDAAPAAPKASDNKEVKAALGKNIAHPNLYSIREKVERGAWNLTVEKVKTDYRGTTTKIEINAPIPSNWVKHTKPYPSSGVEYYDPDKVVIDEDGRTAIKIDTEAAIPKKATPGVIYRGMSWEEYQGALENGHFKSRGDYNLGDEQKGLTYYSSDPGQAVSYAHSYAPSAYKAVPGRPAVVVGVADPGDHYVVPQQPTELGIRTPVPTSAIREVYFGDPILAQPGDTEVIQESGRPPMEGSGMSPSVWVNWRKEGDDNVRELKEASRRHPGEGYTDEAYIANGIVHTNDVYDAARALQEGHAVELDQPRTASLLITELGKISKNMIAHGEEATVFNLCKVTIKGTSLFCADAQGIPRVKMPQLTMEQDQPFFDHLKSKGYTVERHDEYASYLRATQNELNGAKVAGIAAAMRSTEGYHSSSNPIFVSNDNYILDGHHRWAAEIGIDATDNVLANDKTMAVWRVNIPITRLLAEAEAFTGGEGKLSVEDEAARKKSLQAKADAHTDWMNECVPEMMSYGKDQIVAVAACLNMWRQAWEESHPDGADDPGPSRPGSDKYDPDEKQIQTILARARKYFDESKHPRDEHGRWTDGGGSDDPAPVPVPAREGTKADMERRYGKPSANWKATASGLNTKEEQRLEDDDNFIRRNIDDSKFISERGKMINAVPYYSEYVKTDEDHSHWNNFITTPKGIANATLMTSVGEDRPTVEIMHLQAVDRGAGRAALEILTKAADQNGVSLKLDPVPLEPSPGSEGVMMPKADLEAFYAEFGFEQVGERDEGGKGTITMVREPRTAEAAPALTPELTPAQVSFVRDWSQAANWTSHQHAARAVVSGTKPENYVCYDCVGDDKERYAKAAKMIDTINELPDLTVPLYRGLTGGEYKPREGYKVGDRFSESLTSWTTKKTLAEDFASGAYAGGPGKGSPEVLTLDIATSVNSKGINVSDNLSDSANALLREAGEYLTTGEYEVTAVNGRDITVRRVGPAKKVNLKKSLKADWLRACARAQTHLKRSAHSDWMDARARVLARAWNEADHPRDEHGRWTDGGGGESESGFTDQMEEAFRIAETTEKVMALAVETAKKLDFNPALIEYTTEDKKFKVGEAEFNYAGSYQFGDSKITLYMNQLNENNAKGVTAHEIGHRKFQLLTEMYKAETALMMKDPGPPPDPSHQYWWGRKGGTDAMMKPDGTLRPPYDKHYPIYQEWTEIGMMRPSLEQDDGITPYSKMYWTEWEKGTVNTNLAYHETMAEITRAQARMGKHAAGTGAGWRRLYALQEKLWAETDKFTRDTSLVGPVKAIFIIDDIRWEVR